MPSRFPSPSSDSAAGDESLPCELAVLGDRLRRDAHRLADRYPAPNLDRPRRFVRPGGVSVWLAWGAAAAVLLAVASPRFLNPLATDEPAVPRRAVVSAEQARLPAAEPPRPAAAPIERPAAEPASTSARPAVLHQTGVAEIPTEAFLRNVSGPELEGLLDLWEEGEGHSTSLSI
jgi:hypothetical protein